MRICDINGIFSESGGGIRTYHLNKLAYYRSSKEHDYLFLYPFSRRETVRDGRATVMKLRGSSFPGMSHYRFFTGIGEIRKVVREFDPDIIEVGAPYMDPFIVRYAAAGTKAVLTGFWHAHYPAAYVQRFASRIHPRIGKHAEAAAWWFARQTYGRYAATFASAEYIAKELWRHGIPRVFHTPLGTDLALFSPEKRDDELRRRIGAAGGRPVFFFPHRLQQEKGFDTLLAAYPRIARELGSLLVIAGKGPGESYLRRFLRERDDVLFLEHIRDPREMAKWYASSDAVFALSPFETFGLSIAESMASGCPVIGAELGGAGELIRNAGCGTTVPYRDPAALAEAAVSFMKSGEVREKGMNGRRFAVENFSWEQVFDRQLHYYREILEHPFSEENPAAEPRTWNYEYHRLQPL